MMDTDQAPETERELIRQILADNVQALDDRIQANREAELSADAEQLQLKRLRTLAHLAQQYRLLARDADVDEMDTKLNALEHELTEAGKK